MPDNLTVSKEPPAEAAFDHKRLFAAGLECVKTLSGRIWTDYNIHDPGITTLELLCFALTDLAYRSSFPVKDLLAVESDFSGVVQSVDETASTFVVSGEVVKETKGQLQRETRTVTYSVVDGETKVRRGLQELSFAEVRQGLPVSVKGRPNTAGTIATLIDLTDIDITHRFTARTILPNRPLTVLDYRKLLIDIKGVRNAWLKKADLVYYADTVKGELLSRKPALPGIIDVPMMGLYDVTLEYEMGSDEAAVLDSVKARLQANRSLCEDFVSFSKVGEQKFNLCCELELSPDADAAKVEAQIFFQVQEYLAPSVRNYSLTEMLARKNADGSPYTVDQIFTGPALDCGFIDDEELRQSELRTEIRLSDIVSIIMDIDGVKAIRDIVVNPGDVSQPLKDKWLVFVESDKKAVLDRNHSRIVYYKRNMPVHPDSEKSSGIYKELVDAAQAKQDTPVMYELPAPAGEYRDLGIYYSFQNHFPVLYGLSDVGIPAGSDEKRQALAYQLKAYLLFLDQVMGDYFAQLSRVKDFFSIDPQLSRTYFHQVVDSFTGYEKIYAGSGTDATREEIQALLDGLDDAAVSIDRRNRFLDHLIARFAERFHDFVHIMYSAFGSSPETMAALKCEFLNAYPVISSERGLAYNYTLTDDADLWNSENVSGLEKRMARLLGIPNFARRNLGAVSYDIYAEIDTTPGDEFRFRVRKSDTQKILLSSSTHYATRDQAVEEMRRAITAASAPSGYERKTTVDGKYYFNIVDETGEVIARRIEYFSTPEAMESAIHEVIEYLLAKYSGEGMYLIESVLLRPEQDGDPFLPVCPAPGGTDGSEMDPYSYQIHVILPAYGSRFENMDFRRFAEEVIREETPAHIMPRICWTSKEEMVLFERLYRDWIYLKCGREPAGRADKLNAFIAVLTAVRNVYPEEKLAPCAAPEDQPKLILGQSALGTMDTDKPK